MRQALPPLFDKVRKTGVREDILSSLEMEVERFIVGQDETCPLCGADLALMAWDQEEKIKARDIQTASINIKGLISAGSFVYGWE